MMPLSKRILPFFCFAGIFILATNHAFAADVSCPKSPQRIISLSLASDEIVFDLLGEKGRSRLIAVSKSAASPVYSNLAESVKSLPLIGTDLETIVRARPDLVITASYNEAKIKKRLEQAGICVRELSNFNRLADIEQNIAKIGLWLDLEQEGKKAASEFHAAVSKMQARSTSGIRVKAFAYSDGMFIAGRETLFDDIVTAAGGENVTSSLFAGWKKATAESLIQLKPDLIVATDEHGSVEKILEKMERDPATKQFPAVKNKKVIIIPAKTLVSVSQHVAKAIESLRLEISKIEPKKTP
jgi:iron complex transport system substrate-binding protein